MHRKLFAVPAGTASSSSFNPAGQLQSLASFGRGTYGLTFQLSGNQRGTAQQTSPVSLGSESFSVNPTYAIALGID